MFPYLLTLFLPQLWQKALNGGCRPWRWSQNRGEEKTLTIHAFFSVFLQSDRYPLGYENVWFIDSQRTYCLNKWLIKKRKIPYIYFCIVRSVNPQKTYKVCECFGPSATISNTTDLLICSWWDWLCSVCLVSGSGHLHHSRSAKGIAKGRSKVDGWPLCF